MATSGSWTGDRTVSYGPRLKLSWRRTAVDIPNNRSKVKLTLELVADYTVNFSTSKSGSLHGSGFTYTSGFRGTGTKTIKTREFWASHNSDGTKSFSVSAWLDVNVSMSSGYVSRINVGGTINLNRIPRSSKLDSFSIDSDLEPDVANGFSFSSTSYSSDFTHKVTISHGSYEIYSWSNMSTSTTTRGLSVYRVNELLERIPNNNYLTFTLELETFSGSTKIGKSSYMNAVANVDESVLPSISNFAVGIHGSGRDKSIGKYVQSISRVDSSFSRSAGYGANISSSKITIRRQSNKYGTRIIESNTGTTGVLNNNSTYEAIAEVRDTRGRTSEQILTFHVEQYKKPEITEFNAVRDDTTETTVNIRRYGNHYPVGGDNPAEIVLERRVSGGTWAEISGGLAGYTDNNFGAGVTSTGNDTVKSYDFRLTITDSFNNSTEATTSVSTAKVLLDIHKNLGIGIGKLHEQGDLDVAGEAHFEGNMYFQNGIVSRLNSMHQSDTDTPDDMPSGFSYYDSAFSEGFPNNLGGVINFMINGSRNVQLFSDMSDNRLLFRQYHFHSNNGWSDWQDVSSTTKGANSNGQWVRFSNGWQICFIERQLATVSLNSNNMTQEFQWDFPQAFVETSTIDSYNIPAHVSVNGSLFLDGYSSHRYTATHMIAGDFSSNYMRDNKAEFIFESADGNSADKVQWSAMAIGRWR